MLILARDPELRSEARKLLTLDEVGFGLLRRLLKEAQEDRDPIRLLVLDSLSRLKPPDIDENSNTAMTAWLDELAAISIEFGLIDLLIHHTGHQRGDGGPRAPQSAARGASAIGAVPQVDMVLETTKDPRQRRLRVVGNAVHSQAWTFTVAAPDSPPGSIEYFSPDDPFLAYDPGDYLQSGNAISTNELAWRLCGEERDGRETPSGTWTRLAPSLRDYWERKGLVDARDGPRGSKLISLKGDFATSPTPRQSTSARSSAHLATSPIEARGGEVEGALGGTEAGEVGSEQGEGC